MWKKAYARNCLLLLMPLFLSTCGARHWAALQPVEDSFVLVPQEPRCTPRPLSADFDADGQQEAIFRSGERVWIEREGERLWESDPGWRVVDVAVGDVGDDLRVELLLALWKPGLDRVPRSQPYVVGYRHGRFDLLWGGSPVEQPVVELDFGDVDNDGRGELVVLEAPAGTGPGCPARWMSLWRWNGWGFTLLWRSAEGQFRDLTLCDVDGDGVPEAFVRMER